MQEQDRTNVERKLKMKTKKKCKVFVLVMLLFVILQACGKNSSVPEEPDWRDRYGMSANGIVTPEPESPPVTKKPTGDDLPSIDLPYPTPLPMREFVPEEGQVELVLWMFGSHEMHLDDHMLAELNYILQQRGCSFYLTKKVEPAEVKVDQISRWQEALDAGEQVDLIYLGNEDINIAYKAYGNTAVIRAITGGYLLSFSDYPETEAKERLLAAYPEEYWKLCSFQGENYGVSNTVSSLSKQKRYLLFNLDAAEQAGIEVPEELDIWNLDELLSQAEAAGVPGFSWSDVLETCGIKNLKCGLYVKVSEDGSYRIINPLEDEELLSLWDKLYYYVEQGWEGDTLTLDRLPLIMCKIGNDESWEGERFRIGSETENRLVRVKVYEEVERIFVEGSYIEMLGIHSGSEHKEEALELLSLMHGDEEIVQLLRYGIEGVHYKWGEEGLEDVMTSELVIHEHGGVIDEKKWSSPESLSFGNQLMYVEMDETLGKENREEEWYAGCADIKWIPYMEEFDEEQKKVADTIKFITFVIFPNGGFLDKSTFMITIDKNYKAEIEKLRTDFAEAGYNELAEEINKKYGLE